MIVAALLAALVLTDAGLAGFRSAAGRSGLIHKRPHLVRGVVRGVVVGAIVIAVNAGVVAALVLGAAARGPAWEVLHDAGADCVWIFGAFATATLLALIGWASPVREHHVLASIVVLGPLTLLRPLVIVGGLALVVARAGEPSVILIAASATLSMLAIGPVLDRWWLVAGGLAATDAGVAR